MMLYFRAQGLAFSARALSDAAAVCGLCYLIAGLSRLVRRMGLFNSTVFGTKKLWEIIRIRDYDRARSKMKDYVDYTEHHPYNKPFGELLLTASLLLVLAIILAF